VAADERPDLVRSRDMLSPQEIVETLRIPLVGIVPEDEAVLVAGSRGAPLDHGRRSLAGRAFHNMARRL